MQPYRTPVKPLRARDENARPAAGALAAKKKPRPSSLCRTPPTLIKGRLGQQYRRGDCLGQGGFARCFQVNSGDGQLYAAKTIAKATLVHERERVKMLTEIKIHRGLNHRNIVKYIECFEDEVNVYILLEMCANESLYEMSHRRKVLTEPESRFYMVQILGAVSHMHRLLVIHRDLKLGNIFLDSDMNIRVGDFGLAARLSSPHERRLSMCGTPNYISPEVLRRPHEHSFPTDIWACGIMLYALLFGTPPFQEKDVNIIYRRIRDHALVFPVESTVSEAAISLINGMLHPDPNKRTTVEQAMEHRWFKQGFPSSIPTSAAQSRPRFNISQEQSEINFINAKILAGLETGQTTLQPVERVTMEDVAIRSRARVLPDTLSPPGAQDKYKMVLIPDENANNEPANYDSPIVDRQQRPRAPLGAGNTAASSKGGPRAISSAGTGMAQRAIPSISAQEAMPPRATRTSTTLTAAGSEQEMDQATTQQEPMVAHRQKASQLHHSRSTQMLEAVGSNVRASLANTRNSIWKAIEDYNAQQLSALSASPKQEPIYVSKWADFNDNYGVAWGLCDGAVGMRFMDGPSMRMDPRMNTVVRFDSDTNDVSQQGNIIARHLSGGALADDDQRRIQVLQYAADYMFEKLGKQTIANDCPDLSMGAFIANFVRTEKYVMFVLSNGTVQFNFTDHNKLVFLDDGREVFIIAEDRSTYHLPLANAILRAEELEFIGIKPKLEAVVLALMD